MVRACPARADDPAVRGADFLFIDPPDLATGPAIRRCLEATRADSVLVWLPILRREGGSVSVAAGDVGHETAVVRWPPTGSTAGCRLLYRLPPRATAALEAAIAHVCAAAGWEHRAGRADA